MELIRVGLVADPAAPTGIARRLGDLSPRDGSAVWDITVVSEPFTTGSEDVDTAMGRLQDHARQQGWDLVVGLTELPLHDHEGRPLLVETDPDRRNQCFDRVTLELQRSLDNFERQYSFISIAKLALGPSPVSGLDEYLSSNLYTPVETLDLATLLDLSRTPELADKAQQQRFFLAIGAALREGEGA